MYIDASRLNKITLIYNKNIKYLCNKMIVVKVTDPIIKYFLEIYEY